MAVYFRPQFRENLPARALVRRLYAPQIDAVEFARHVIAELPYFLDAQRSSGGRKPGPVGLRRRQEIRAVAEAGFPVLAFAVEAVFAQHAVDHMSGFMVDDPERLALRW